MSGRSEAIEGVEAHIGLFTNTLPVRLRLRPDQPLLEQLANVQQRQIRLLEHDGLGLGEIQRLCGVPNLFDTLLVVENYPEDAELFAADFGGLRCVGARNRGYTHYPLTLMVLPGRELELRLEYREGVKEPERIARRVTRLLEQIVDRPDAPLSAMDVLLPEERDLLARVNTTKVANHPAAPCASCSADQAQCTPDAHRAGRRRSCAVLPRGSAASDGARAQLRGHRRHDRRHRRDCAAAFSSTRHRADGRARSGRRLSAARHQLSGRTSCVHGARRSTSPHRHDARSAEALRAIGRIARL